MCLLPPIWARQVEIQGRPSTLVTIAEGLNYCCSIGEDRIKGGEVPEPQEVYHEKWSLKKFIFLWTIKLGRFIVLDNMLPIFHNTTLPFLELYLETILTLFS